MTKISVIIWKSHLDSVKVLKLFLKFSIKLLLLTVGCRHQTSVHSGESDKHNYKVSIKHQHNFGLIYQSNYTSQSNLASSIIDNLLPYFLAIFISAFNSFLFQFRPWKIFSLMLYLELKCESVCWCYFNLSSSPNSPKLKSILWEILKVYQV